MASPDTDLIEHWLEDGAHCLELWLACGVSTPTPAAKAALQHWSAAAETAGFAAVVESAQCLLSSESSSDEKADALMDLLVWQLSLQRTYTAKRLQLHYNESS